MNRYQSTVLWIGLLLIALNLAIKWPTVRKAIFTKQQPTIQNVNVNTSSQLSNMMQVPFVFGKTPDQSLAPSV